jgi:dipeptide/tripeptide permease
LQATLWIQAGTIAGLLAGGWLADRWAKAFVAGRTCVQMLGVLLAAPQLVAVGTMESWPVLVTAMTLYGVGVGLYQSNLWTTTFEVIDPAARSTAIGLLNVIAGTLGSWFNPLIGHFQDRVGGLGSALAILSVALAASLVILVYDARCLLPAEYQGPLRTPPQ